MKLFHFTATHLLNKITQQGLTLGCIPQTVKPTRLIQGYQWLTRNSSFKQSWCAYGFGTLPYYRNSFRITIEIPRKHKKNLYKWIEWGKQFESYEGLSSLGDPENWYV